MIDWLRILFGKCKFFRVCHLYREGSEVCNKYGGMYYGPYQPAGCYRKLDKVKK